MKHYRIYISLMSCFFYFLQLLPNIIWQLKPPADNVLADNKGPVFLMDAIEWSCGILVTALLILVHRKNGERNHIGFLIFAITALCIYYFGWILYYQGVVSPLVIIGGLVAMPPLYFLSLGLWMKIYIMIVPAVIFFIFHIWIACCNMLK